MINQLLLQLFPSRKTSRSYSRVVSDANKQTVVELLRQAAKEANADQKKLVESVR